VFLADGCGGSFLLVSFLASGANSLGRGVVFGVVGAAISVSVTSGSLLAVVESAGLVGFAGWKGICSGGMDNKFWTSSGCTCCNVDGDGLKCVSGSF
ncbi:hypothetical protein Tco_0504458, partial [Tanacetum coccineum]